MNGMTKALILLLAISTNTASATDLAKLKGESVRVSPNGEYAVWCRITAAEWIKNSWKIPLYPFAIAISGHMVPFKWGFREKCTLVDKNKNDLFPWPYGGNPPVWSTDGHSVSLDGGKNFQSLK